MGADTDSTPVLEPRLDLGQGVVEEAVGFLVEGTLVAGTLALPAGDAALGVVIAHGWSGYRSGPHGLLTFLARRLAGAGYPTLRFDFRGRGESGGEGLQTSLVSMADDLVSASEWMAARCRVKGLVYLGLCSGGNVAIGALKRLPRARGLVLLSVYPFSDGDAFSRDVHRTWHYAGVYLRKALRGETWSRLVRGDVHVGQVLNVLFGHFLRRGRNRRKEEGASCAASPGAPGPAATAAVSRAAAPGRTAKAASAESRLQGKEPPRRHLANLTPDLPALMVYGTADPDAPAARRYFGDYAREHGLPIEFVDIPDASHNFPSLAWKARVADLAVEFVGRLG